jgi:hypothetical protein
MSEFITGPENNLENAAEKVAPSLGEEALGAMPEIAPAEDETTDDFDWDQWEKELSPVQTDYLDFIKQHNSEFQLSNEDIRDILESNDEGEIMGNILSYVEQNDSEVDVATALEYLFEAGLYNEPEEEENL